MARRRHAPVGSRAADRGAPVPVLRDFLPELRHPLPLGPGAPVRGSGPALLRDSLPGLRGALPLLVPGALRPRSAVRGSALALVVDAPLGAGASDERSVPLLLPVVVLFSPLEPAALALRRLLPPQRLAARLSGTGSGKRPEGAARPGGALSSSPSRMRA